MKSPIVTDNGRRTKTNPDQSSLISYSTIKSCASSVTTLLINRNEKLK